MLVSLTSSVPPSTIVTHRVIGRDKSHRDEKKNRKSLAEKGTKRKVKRKKKKEAARDQQNAKVGEQKKLLELKPTLRNYLLLRTY